MFKRTASVNWTTAGMQAQLTTSAWTDALFVIFYTAGPEPAPENVLGDFTLASLGAAGQELDALVAGPTLDGGIPCVHQELSVLAGASPTNETLLGALITRTSAAGVLQAVVKFETPVPIVNEGDGLIWDVVVNTMPVSYTGLAE